MKLKELLLQSRSYRSFDPSVKITRDQLCEWIAHARFAPSSINAQMIKFRPVCDAAECDAVLANTRWAAKIKDQKIPPVGHEPVAYIVLCMDTKVVPPAEMFLKDVGICAQTVMLAASEAGFGGCMIGSYQKKEIKEILSIPDEMDPQLVLALGKPDETVTLTDPSADGSVTYYRENGIHYVQKRSLEHLIIE